MRKEGGTEVTMRKEGETEVTMRKEGGAEVTMRKEGGTEVTMRKEGGTEVTMRNEGGTEVTLRKEGQLETDGSDGYSACVDSTKGVNQRKLRRHVPRTQQRRSHESLAVILTWHASKDNAPKLH